MYRHVLKFSWGLLFVAATACSRQQETAPAAVSPPGDETAAVDTPKAVQQVDGQPIESLAGVRRDGAGQIVELNLRDAEPGAVSPLLAAAGQMPKLRSLLLNEAALTASDVQHIAAISSLEHLDLRGCPIDDAALEQLTGLPRLKAVRLSGQDGDTKVTDAGLQSLSGLPALAVLAIDFLPITDRGLESLAGRKQLRELYAAGTKLTDSAAETLKQLPQLGKLRLASTGFTSRGINQLVAGKPPLVELDLSDCLGVDDRALESIGDLKSLTKLNLYGTAVTTGRWDRIGGLSELRWLNVDKTGVDDAALVAIGQLKSLRFLHLGSTRISDAGLKHLTGLDGLEELIVTRTAVTRAGVERLQAELPSTEIQLQYVAGR